MLVAPLPAFVECEAARHGPPNRPPFSGRADATSFEITRAATPARELVRPVGTSSPLHVANLHRLRQRRDRLARGDELLRDVPLVPRLDDRLHDRGVVQ